MEQVLAIQSAAIDAAWESMVTAQETGDHNGVVSASYAINAGASTFAKLQESADVQKQLDAIKAEVESLRSGPSLRKVA